MNWSGEFDDPDFRGPTQEWIAFWQRQDSRPWALKSQTLAGQTHFSAAPEAFRQGLHWVLSGEPVTIHQDLVQD